MRCLPAARLARLSPCLVALVAHLVVAVQAEHLALEARPCRRVTVPFCKAPATRGARHTSTLELPAHQARLQTKAPQVVARHQQRPRRRPLPHLHLVPQLRRLALSGRPTRAPRQPRRRQSHRRWSRRKCKTRQRLSRPTREARRRLSTASSARRRRHAKNCSMRGLSKGKSQRSSATLWRVVSTTRLG